jgi:hypothetical protein
MRFPLGPVALLALLGTFLLPFIDFSCRGKKVVTMTGYEVAFGAQSTAELDLGKLFGEEGDRSSAPRIEFRAEDRSNRNLFVTAALIVGVAGGAIGLMRPFLGALGGIAAAVLLLIAQADMQKEVQRREVPMLVLAFREGYWISLGCAAAGGVLCLLRGRK